MKCALALPVLTGLLYLTASEARAQAANETAADSRCPMEGQHLKTVVSTNIRGTVSDSKAGVTPGVNLPELTTASIEADASVYVRLSVDGYSDQNFQPNDVNYFDTELVLSQGVKHLQECSATSISRRASSAHLIVAECSARAEKKGPISINARVHFNGNFSSVENAKIEVCHN
jgi:hypothetical protein